MIPILKNKQAWQTIDEKTRTAAADPLITSKVADIITAVKREGDAALKKFAQQFGDPDPGRFQLSPEEVKTAEERVPPTRQQVIRTAAENIRSFAEAVMDSIKPVAVKRDGYESGLDYIPVKSAGCYVPSGRYALISSALMTAVTASAAGVKDIALVSPRMPDEVVLAGQLAGATRFYKIGGGQAVAALAFGTESVKRVDMLVGPGNAYVTEAKRQLQGVIGIDMLAGPSEVVIIADKGAAAADLAMEILAQAEHDPDARAWLLTDDDRLAGETQNTVEKILSDMPLPPFVKTSLNKQGILILKDLEECVTAANILAPEHLVLSVNNPDNLKVKLNNYGALFMGYEATVAFGDYMAGPNHTLPTGTTSRFSEGLNPRTFLRARSYFKATGDLSLLAFATSAFAEMEGMALHACAARRRLKNP